MNSLFNREGWLTELANEISPFYKLKGYRPHNYRLTCGWPCKNALGIKTRRIGECHSQLSSKDNVCEIFISPLEDNSLEVAGVVCHELLHSAVGIPAGHKGKFALGCKHLGLTRGKPTQAMPNEVLNDRLFKIIEKLGQYPHQALVLQPKPKKPTDRVTLKCECGCSISITQKWLIEAGLPTCGCGAYFSELGA